MCLDFEFLTDKIQVNAGMFNDSMKLSKTFHLICTPERCIQLVQGITSERAHVLDKYPEVDKTSFPKPFFIWEPMEDSCRPQELSAFYQALGYVDVFSPNEHELGLLFSGLDDDKAWSVEQCCRELLHFGFGNRTGTVVVRLGADGCVVASEKRLFKIPAYHIPPIDNNSASDFRVKDVTGGGNTFLGGFCKGLLARREGSMNSHGLNENEIGAIYGSVAASFAIEQIGMPKMSYRKEDGQELWNGELVSDRLDDMISIAITTPSSLRVS